MLYNPHAYTECSECGHSIERFRSCDNCATLKKLKGKICPCCKGEDIRLDQTRESNGVLGPGHSSWVVAEHFVCNDCGIMFKSSNKNEKNKKDS